MMETEPFPFHQEDAVGTSAAAVEELFSWDFRGLSDLVPPALDPSPLPSEEDILLWGIPLAENYAALLGAVPPPPPPPQPPAGGEELPLWAMSPVLEEPPVITPGVRRMSAFVGYERGRYYYCCGRGNGSRAGGGEKENIHKRLMRCLRKIPVEKTEKKPVESSRCFRHMMRERQRRERLSQSYSDLHSMIVPRPKANKNAIVLSAAAYVRELKSRREALQKRHRELRAGLGDGGVGGRPDGATIKLRVGSPTSPVDSMIAALRQLKGMGVRARSVRSCADGRELSAVIVVETKLVTEEVQGAVEGALVETERKLRSGPGACRR